MGRNAEARPCPPAHVVLIDIRLSDTDELTACQVLRSTYPETRIVFLTSSHDEATAAEAVFHGAAGYVLRDISQEELVLAIKTAACGETILTSAVTEEILGRMAQLHLAEPDTLPLSYQERRVVILVAQGLTNKEIARELGLSDKTVRNYLYRVYKKLQVKGRAHAASVYLQRHTARIIHPYN